MDTLNKKAISRIAGDWKMYLGSVYHMRRMI
jgi:hypothetical protein